MTSLKAELILRSGVQDREGHPCAVGVAFVVIVCVLMIEIAGTRTLMEGTIDTQALIYQI